VLATDAPPSSFLRVPARAGAGRMRSRGDRVFRLLTLAAALVLPALVAAIGVQLWEASRLARERFGVGFLWHETWNPVASQFGALPFLYGTVVSSAIALALAGPAGVVVAIYLAEMAPSWISRPLGTLVELLAAVPSVVYGLWGVFVLIPWLRAWVEVPVSLHLSRVPLLAGPVYGPGLLAAGVVLAIMILPTVAAISREVLLAIPGSQRDAALALGVTRWEVIRHILLPAARRGIAGALGLGIGRALGETMAATMVIGNTARISASLLAPGYSLPSVIANEFTEASTPLYLSALVELGLLLFGVTLAVNVLARMLVRGAVR
jgi:phosphate transport system permease protein